jgi:hypothetical protein
MANSKLLKEAIADAKAVRETAIANAKIALEEAFTPRLQSILSKKLQAEMEGEEEEIEEELDSSDIGDGDNVEPSADASDAHTELGPETEEETAEVGDELEEGEGSVEDPTNADDATISEEEEVEIEEEESEEEISEEEDEIEEYGEGEEIEEEEDELDLESIIRELEMGMEDEDEVSEEEEIEETESEEEMHEEDEEEVHEEEESEIEEEESEEEISEEEDELDEEDEIDLDEILREMGYGDDEEVSEDSHEDSEMEEKYEELEKDLEEAYATIKSLKGTINEVNLLNAKLLYANRLFRAYNLNNEQKSKVVENLDRTSSVREVKLVYATLAESMNFTGTQKKTKKVVAEAASKPVASTAPKKQIISENTNALAERFKQLANIK